jgi:acyl-ACP thioesterase
MSHEANVFTTRFTARSYQLDVKARVGLGSLCRLLQEAAGLHAEALDVALERMAPLGCFWVLGRMHLQLEGEVEWMDPVDVETWPSGLDELRASRDFVLRRDGVAFGRATSAWLVVDAERRRPVRMPRFVRDLVRPERPRALDDRFERLVVSDALPVTASLPVRRTDLDLNRHVTNAVYVDWLVETLPEPVWREQRPRALEIVFRGEARLGDEIVGRCAPAGGGSFEHRLERADGRPVALARTRWTAG